MKNTLETRLGLFIALAMVAGFFILQVIGSLDFLKPAYTLNARFDNIQQLKPGDSVKMAGVPIGRVQSLHLADNKVEVVLRLSKDAPVKTDSKATVKFAGLMGENYVSVDFGSSTAPRLEAGSEIKTVEQPDLSALMAKLDDVATGVQNLTKSFTGDKIDNLLGPFTDFMRQNNPRLSAIIANMQAVSTQISEGKGTVGKLIYDDALYKTAKSTMSTAGTTMTNFQEVAAEVKATVARAQTIVDQVNSGQGTIGKLIKDETLYRETTGSMSNLNQILTKINSGQGTIGKVVNDQEFYRNAKLSLQKLDKATESLEDTGPLSLFGSIISTLF